MERDPLRFAWRAAPFLHGIAFALIGLALPLAWIGLDLVRTVLDDAVAGRAFGAGPSAPFGRFAIALPDRLAGPPVLLFPGVPLSRFGFAAASSFGARRGARARGRPRLRPRPAPGRDRGAGRRVPPRAVLDGLARARPAAGEEARTAATLLGRELRAAGGVSRRRASHAPWRRSRR